MRCGCQAAPPQQEMCLALAKPQPPQTTSTAWPQQPVQAPPHLLHTAEAALDLAVPHGMPRAGHSHNGRPLCAVVAEHCLLIIWKTSEIHKNSKLINHLSRPQHPVQAPPHLLHTPEAVFHLSVPHGMPRAGPLHASRALCAVVAEHCLLIWKFPQIHKTATPTTQRSCRVDKLDCL